MAMWLVRATKEVIERASPATMAQRFVTSFIDGEGKPVSNAVAIWQPDLSAVQGQPLKYWTITGDVVSLMPQAERDAVDAALLTARRDALIAQIDNLEDILRAAVLGLNDAINQTNGRVNAVLDAIDAGASLAAIKTAVAAINNLPQRTTADVRAALRAKLGNGS